MVEFLKIKIGLVFLSLVFLGCSGLERRVDVAADEEESSRIEAAHEADEDAEESEPEFSEIPYVMNPHVQRWLDYFQGRGRRHMQVYLSRMSQYGDYMKSVLREEGLPEDLIYVALIESGFSARARSHANAVGYWQFIRSTGLHYGLQIDSYVDERRDFALATQAAADYLKALYNLFGDWYLALASYNVGENRVKGLIMRHQTRDFWEIAQGRRLPRETQNYVPKFLAARLIGENPQEYGFDEIEIREPVQYALVEYEASVDLEKLAQQLDVDGQVIRDLNPSYRRGVALENEYGRVTLRVPMESLARAEEIESSLIAMADRSYPADDYQYYRIRRGDNLIRIARRFGTTPRRLMSLNNLRYGSTIYAGQRLRVPNDTPQAMRRASASSSSRPSVHIVRRGDTLSGIARRYGVPLQRLAAHNGIQTSNVIHVGRRLRIPE